MFIATTYLTLLHCITPIIVDSQSAASQDPKATEVWTPVPKIVTPGPIPSDAVRLDDVKHWQQTDGSATKWTTMNGGFMVKPRTGDIRSKASFGDCQLHIEWASPKVVKGEGQGRGNSGVFFMQQYELQVLDSYDNVTYSNGQAGSIYKQYLPLVNVCKPAGQWQTYDVIFTAPKFNADGTLRSAARVTAIQNGVLVLNNVELLGPTMYIGKPVYKSHSSKLPLELQDHGDLVSYRNMWVREL